jgi:hypothetical protein
MLLRDQGIEARRFSHDPILRWNNKNGDVLVQVRIFSTEQGNMKECDTAKARVPTQSIERGRDSRTFIPAVKLRAYED